MFKKGQLVVTVDHDVHQFLSKGAVITPPKQRRIKGGKQGVITAVLEDGYEVRFGEGELAGYEEMPAEWLKAR